MLEKHPERATCFFAAQFEPEVAFIAKLPPVAEAINKNMPQNRWSAGPQTYRFREESGRYLTILNHQQLLFQTLGYDTWVKHRDNFRSEMLHYLELLSVTRVKRLGFQVLAWIDLEMTLPEMTNLFFGSVFAERDAFPDELRGTKDGLFQLIGDYDDFNFTVHVTPQSEEQAKSHIAAIPNLKEFQRDTMDATVIEFGRRLQRDCLVVDVDLSQRDCDITEIASFATRAPAVAEQICIKLINFLQALPSQHNG